MIKKLFEELTLSDGEAREIRDFYNEYHSGTIEPLSESAYNEFRISGKRLSYEKLYFDRRKRLDGCLMMYKAFGAQYLPELCDLLYAVSSERAWALPAHTLNSPNPREEIDLFAAETAQTLTEISYILSDVLERELKDRIAYEVRSRVTGVFEKRRFGWENAEHNWSAVCGGCIGMVYLYNNKPVPKRVFDALERYMSGINNDGVCLEGVGYWGYGFGYYMYFASLLKEKTGTDIISTDKADAAAHFGQRAYLGKNAVSCSDCEPDTALPPGLMGLLNKYFDGIYMPRSRYARYDGCGRWADYIRSYLYPLPRVREETGEFIYPVSQWYINKKKSFSFFIKGGGNDEPHNHNDAGSFIIADSENELIADIGCGEYTRQYFNDDTRYDYLCASSLGHNVPIVDGRPQMRGSGFGASGFLCKNGHVSMEIGGAYSPRVSIKRAVKISDSSVTLTDAFGEGHKITERFVTRIKPAEKDGEIIIGSLSVKRPDKISRAKYSNHAGSTDYVYLLDYEVRDNIFEIVFKINQGH